MSKESLKSYGDEELSLRVMNDEGLYDMRLDQEFYDVIADTFTYTPAQLADLKADIDAEIEDLKLEAKLDRMDSAANGEYEYPR